MLIMCMVPSSTAVLLPIKKKGSGSVPEAEPGHENAQGSVSSWGEAKSAWDYLKQWNGL